jgi:hypothetical protein
VAKPAWAGKGRSDKALAIVVRDHVLPFLPALQDLVVIDDLSALTIPLITSSRGGVDPSNAADAYKRLMKWARHSDFAFVAGIPTSTETPVNTAEPQWERLRTHAILRPVTVVRKADDLASDKVRIVVGRDAYSVDVDSSILQLPNRIIV